MLNFCTTGSFIILSAGKEFFFEGVLMDCKLKKFDKKDYMDASCFVWNGIKLNKEKRSYPLAPNEKFLEEEFYKCAVTDKSAELIGFYKDGILTGVMSFFYQKREKYLQTTCLFSLTDDEEVIRALVTYLLDNYPGYQINVGVEASYTKAKIVLEHLFFNLDEDSYTYRQTTSNPAVKEYKKACEVVPVTLKNLEEYLVYHKEHFDEEYYWTSERIRDNFDIFKIYALYIEEKIKGCVFIQKYEGTPQYEVFGLESPDTENGQKILETAYVDLMESDNDFRSLLFFVDVEEEMSRDLCHSLSFTEISHYNLYRKNN